MELIADLHLSKLAFLSSDGSQFRIYIKHMPHCPAAKYNCFFLIFKKKKSYPLRQDLWLIKIDLKGNG